jgi:hypothetical protein
MSMIVMNLEKPKVGAKDELLFNKPALISKTFEQIVYFSTSVGRLSYKQTKILI